MSKEKFSIGSETVIGMVHCLPLPTTAGFDGDYQKILDRAVQDAVTLEKSRSGCSDRRKYGRHSVFSATE